MTTKYHVAVAYERYMAESLACENFPARGHGASSETSFCGSTQDIMQDIVDRLQLLLQGQGHFPLEHWQQETRTTTSPLLLQLVFLLEHLRLQLQQVAATP